MRVGSLSPENVTIATFQLNYSKKIYATFEVICYLQACLGKQLEVIAIQIEGLYCTFAHAVTYEL